MSDTVKGIELLLRVDTGYVVKVIQFIGRVSWLSTSVVWNRLVDGLRAHSRRNKLGARLRTRLAGLGVRPALVEVLQGKVLLVHMRAIFPPLGSHASL